jgi:signal transduction histidine kinase
VLLWTPLEASGITSEKELTQLLDTAAFFAKTNQDKSLQYYKEALRLAKEKKLNLLQAKAYYGIMVYHYKQFDYTKAYGFADSLEKTAPTDRFKLLALEIKGNVHWYNGRFDSAASYYHRVKKIAEITNDSLKLATIQKDLGDYYRQTGNYMTAIEYFNNAIEILINTKNTSVLPAVYNNFSIVFSSMGDYHKELEYLLKAFELKKGSTDYASLALYTKNIADVYVQLKEYKTALQKSKEANMLIKKSPFLRFEIYIKETTGRVYYFLEQYDSAKYYLNEALFLSDSVGEKRYQARINKSLGDLEAANGSFLLADEYYQKSLLYYEHIEDPVYEAKTYLSISNNALKLNDVNLAYETLQQAQLIANTFGNKSVLLNVYSLWATFYEYKQNYTESIIYLKKQDSLNKVVFNEDRLKYIAINEIMFDTKMSALENANLKKNLALQNVKYDEQSSRLNVGFIIIIAILLIAISLYYAYSRISASKSKITLQNEQLQKKNKEIEQANQQQMDLIHLVAHDLKSPFNKIKGLAGILLSEKGLSEEQIALIQMIEKISDNSRKFIINLLEAQDVEQKALEPNFKSVNVQNLIATCYDELQQMTEAKGQKTQFTNHIKQNLHITIDDELMQHAMLNLFSNAVKFSPAASNISFETETNDNHVLFHVKDEGPGFTEKDRTMLYNKFQKLSAQPTNNESSTGLGLYLVKALIEKMGGKIQLVPSTIGANFTISIPYQNPSN